MNSRQGRGESHATPVQENGWHIGSSLALEGLEEYDRPQQGDARYVDKLQAAFVYIDRIQGWVEITAFA